MKIRNVLLVVLVLACGSMAGSSQLYPSAKYAATRVGDPPSGQTRVDFYRWVGQNYDLVGNVVYDPTAIKLANPICNVFRYNFLIGYYDHGTGGEGNHYLGSYLDSKAYAAVHALNWENFFLHYATDTIINPSGQKAANTQLTYDTDYYDSTGAWKGIKVPAGSRVVCATTSTSTVWGAYLGGTYGKWLIDHDAGEPLGLYDGTMYDAFDGKWMYLGNPVGSVSIKEYPGDATTRTNAWAVDVAAICAYARTKYTPIGKLVGGNTSAGFRTDIDAGLDWALREAYWTSDQSAWYYETKSGGFFDKNAIWRQAQTSGKMQMLQHQLRLRNMLGDTAAVWARDKQLALAIFYIGQAPATDYFGCWWGFYYGSNLSFYDVPAIKVDIGQPALPPAGITTTWPQGAYLFATGTDTTVSDGLSKYRVYARNYTNGLVLVRPRSDRVTSVGTVGGVGDNTAIDFSLPGFFYPVGTDGVLGPVTNHLTLRNGEGAILVKEKVVPPPPPPALIVAAGPDVSIIAGNSVVLQGSATGGVVPYVYAWSPTTGLDNPAAAHPNASPVATTVYTLTVRDSAGQTASDSATVTVTAPPPPPPPIPVSLSLYWSVTVSGKIATYLGQYENDSGADVAIGIAVIDLPPSQTFMTESCRLNGKKIAPDVVDGVVTIVLGPVAIGETGTFVFKAKVK